LYRAKIQNTIATSFLEVAPIPSAYGVDASKKNGAVTYAQVGPPQDDEGELVDC